jgi:diadenosine tetraphosphate (Ap4A) HIT family hydrolase
VTQANCSFFLRESPFTRAVAYIEDRLAVCDCVDDNPGCPRRPIAWIDDPGSARDLLSKAYDADLACDASALAALPLRYGPHCSTWVLSDHPQAAKCNANKGARDNKDLRIIREGINRRQPGCVFCEVSKERVIDFNELPFAMRDKYPVTELHTIVIPKRHALSFFDLFEPERPAINQLLDRLRAEIIKKDAMVTGFNIGINNGETAGQTVGHAHVHLIPRRRGDVQDPRGGVRGLIPGKAIY